MTLNDERLGKTLFDAARGGDAVAIEQLLKAGANPDGQDDSGRTALHYAVDGGHADAAACLLAYSRTCHRIADRVGRTPLAPDRVPPEMLHAIRQRYQRFRTHDFARQDLPPETRRIADEFDSRGLVRLPAFVDAQTLGHMREGFDAFIRELDAKLERGEGIKRRYDEELHWWPDDCAYISNNAFKYSVDLVRFCLDERLLGVVNLYLGKPAFIQRAVAARYLPAESSDKRAFHWHHDMEEKRLKMMILLTDVGDQDQYMSYVVGSHKIYHPYEMFLRNTCTLDYCREHLGEIEIAHTIGSAGDVFFFDSNGAHRGIRRPKAAVRDVLFIEFAANNAQVWGGDLDRAAVDGFAGAYPNPFLRMQSAQKKWLVPVIRTAPTWIETLPSIEAWL